MTKIALLLVSILLIICTFTGCRWIFTKNGVILTEDDYSLTEIEGDVKCHFTIGENAAYVQTDAAFDKEEFVKLFHEFNQYDPAYLRYHLDRCDLKIDPETQPELSREIYENEVSIRASFDGTYRTVSVFPYESKLYFFVLNMGGSGAPDEEGDYFIELSKESDEYWHPIIDQVIQDSANKTGNG